jgi:hypothetical protein
VKDEVYFPPVHITLKNLEDRLRTAIAKADQPYCKMCGTKSNIFLCRATNAAHFQIALGLAGRGELFELLLQLCAFNICAAITFLPINLCNR